MISKFGNFINQNGGILTNAKLYSNIPMKKIEKTTEKIETTPTTFTYLNSIFVSFINKIKQK